MPWSTDCSAIEPGPPADFLSWGQVAMFVGPWQPRRRTCDIGAAGVASVSSEVVTLPVSIPRSCASSRIVFTS
jgi:hypothetical protein